MGDFAGGVIGGAIGAVLARPSGTASSRSPTGRSGSSRSRSGSSSVRAWCSGRASPVDRARADQRGVHARRRWLSAIPDRATTSSGRGRRDLRPSSVSRSPRSLVAASSASPPRSISAVLTRVRADHPAVLGDCGLGGVHHPDAGGHALERLTRPVAGTPVPRHSADASTEAKQPPKPECGDEFGRAVRKPNLSRSPAEFADPTNHIA